MNSRAQKILIGLAVIILVGLFVAGLVTGAVVYGWKATVRAGNEAATVQNLKTIGAVQIQYFNNHNRSFGTFEELAKEELLSSKFRANPLVVDGYVIRMTVIPPTPNRESLFKVTADPRDESSGRKHFYLDSTSRQIHVNPDQTAGPDDPPLSAS
jgi:type II secretory pathway pseudopilin PulG